MNKEEAGKLAKAALQSQGFIADLAIQDGVDYRDYLRESIADIQSVVAESRVSGVLGNELGEKLRAFSIAVEKEIERLATPGATSKDDILSIIPQYREFIKDNIVEAIRVHLIGFFRANEKDLSGTIFEDPILSEDQKRARAHYVQEFIANFLTHLYILKISTTTNNTDRKIPIRLATRKMPEFTSSFFYGSYIQDILKNEGIHLSADEEKGLFSDATKRFLIFNFLSNISKPIIDITKNWLNLSDSEYIAKHVPVLPNSIFSSGIRRQLAIHVSPERLPQYMQLVAENYRVLSDPEILRSELENKQHLRVTSGLDFAHNLTKNTGIVISKDMVQLIASWIRGQLSLDKVDGLRKNIIFEDQKKTEKKPG